MERRSFIRMAGASAAAAALTSGHAFAQDAPEPKPTGEARATKFQIGMLVFDQMTNQDFVGPCDSLSRVRALKVNVIGKQQGLVTTDSGVRVMAEVGLAEVPALDLIFVPGGPGTTRLMEDAEVLDFLRAQGRSAKWVTSVCTGGLVLGAAGLLKGYRAATHWSAMDMLPLFGATPVHERVVFDRNRVTGGGVTAGIDFGLSLIAKLFGREQAELIQLGQEYNPAPPFNAGSPEQAPEIAARYRELTKGMQALRLAAAPRAAARLG